MYRAYLPDDAQLSYLNMHYPDPRDSISVSNKKVPTKVKNLNIKDQSISENVSSAVDTATEGANAGRL